MTNQIPPDLGAEIDSLRPGIEAYSEETVPFPDQLNEYPELWPLFLHLGRDTRCPGCEGDGRRCRLCAGRGEVQHKGMQP